MGNVSSQEAGIRRYVFGMLSRLRPTLFITVILNGFGAWHIHQMERALLLQVMTILSRYGILLMRSLSTPTFTIRIRSGMHCGLPMVDTSLHQATMGQYRSGLHRVPCRACKGLLLLSGSQ